MDDILGDGKPFLSPNPALAVSATLSGKSPFPYSLDCCRSGRTRSRICAALRPACAGSRPGQHPPLRWIRST